MPPRIPKIPSGRFAVASGSRPAFEQKAFAKSSSPWSSSSNLATMRHPADMTGEELGAACVAAARGAVESAPFWDLVVERAVTLGPVMEPREISLLLNGLSRTRQLSSRLSAVKSLDPVIRSKLAYFSSIQLAMTVSALAKAFSVSSLPPELIAALVKETKSRIHEFSTGVEFSMILNGLAKLGVVDSALATRLASVVSSRLATTSFHVRELCVIASALASLGVKDATVFDTIVARAVPVAAEATPAELARLAAAVAKANGPLEKVLIATLETHGHRFRFLSPTDVTSAVFGFGSVCEHAECNSSLTALLDELKVAFIGSLPLFQPKDIASVLTSFARWRVALSAAERDAVVSKLISMSRRIDGQEAVAIVASLESAELAQMLRPAVVVELSSCGKLTSAEWQATAKAVAGMVRSGLVDSSLIDAIGICVIKNSASMDRSVGAALRESLSAVLEPDHDLRLALAELHR